jgi:hypothetical protein
MHTPKMQNSKKNQFEKREAIILYLPKYKHKLNEATNERAKIKGIHKSSGINAVIKQNNNGNNEEKNVFNELAIEWEPIKILANECVPNRKKGCQFLMFSQKTE